MGGMLALAYAAKYPINVDRLILIGSGGATPNFFNYFNSNIKMRLREEDLAESKAANGLAFHMRAIWPGYFYNRESALTTKVLVDTNLANHNAGYQCCHLFVVVLENFQNGSCLSALSQQNIFECFRGDFNVIFDKHLFSLMNLCCQQVQIGIKRSGILLVAGHSSSYGIPMFGIP